MIVLMTADISFTFKQLVTVVGGASVILGALWGVFSFISGQRALKLELEEHKTRCGTEMKCIKEEQQVMCYCILAILDGLKQLDCNGVVSDAKEKMSKHLNMAAHDNV